MPDTQSNITSPPAVPGQPYDACSDAPCGPWVKPTDVADFGPADGQIPGADTDGKWRQT